LIFVVLLPPAGPGVTASDDEITARLTSVFRSALVPRVSARSAAALSSSSSRSKGGAVVRTTPAETLGRHAFEVTGKAVEGAAMAPNTLSVVAESWPDEVEALVVVVSSWVAEKSLFSDSRADTAGVKTVSGNTFEATVMTVAVFGRLWLASGWVELAAGWVELPSDWVELIAGWAELASDLAELVSSWAELAAGWVELASDLAELVSGWAELAAAGCAELVSGWAELAAGWVELASDVVELVSGWTELAAACWAELVSSWAELPAGWVELVSGWVELTSDLAELLSGWVELASDSEMSKGLVCGDTGPEDDIFSSFVSSFKRLLDISNSSSSSSAV
jgi:hypothetical protein